MIVWANEHQDLSNFQGTVLSKGIFLVFDQGSEDFIGKNRREKVKDRILVKKAGKRVVFWVLTVIHQ